jgi:peroxiredoxin (alkyl hydroperoxide reductase subunit C)
MWNEQELSKMAGNTPFPMMSDQNGEIGRLYGVYDEQSGVSLRGTFIIDTDGNVQSLEILSMPIGRNVTEGLRQIKAMQMVRNSKGKEVAPAIWEPGKKSIKPRPELVGNVWQEWNINDL